MRCFISLLATSVMLVATTSNASDATKPCPVITDDIQDKKVVIDDSQIRCIKIKDELEIIEVKGLRLSPISQTSDGSYTLDKNLINDYMFNNGNLTELLKILPGTQYSEASLNSNQASNIKPSEVSLSGAQGYQSSYNINGINNNSRLSTGNAEADRNLLQDVAGHSQSTFINLKLLESIEVFDSNIPAKYGHLSGGLVNAVTMNATEQLNYGLSYRQASSQWNKFHVIQGPSQEGTQAVILPEFNKHSLNLYLATPLSINSGLVAQIQWLTSRETLVQLGQSKRRQQQHNGNLLLKYHSDIGSNDDITLTAYYAPYQGDYFDRQVKNSDYSIYGGGYSASAAWQHDNNWAHIETQLSVSRSENSKKSSNYFFTWNSIIGKSWGNIYQSPISLEGGYGDIDKIQQTLRLTTDIDMQGLSLFDIPVELNFGVDINQQTQEFNRLTDTILYNSAITAPNINCASYYLDCIETQYRQPLHDLEQQLGRQLDYTNIDDLLLYEANVIQAGQYFQTRQLAAKKNIAVKVNNLALYGELHWLSSPLHITTGLRYDYNDFFKQHNLAPRFRISADLFNDPDHQLVAGINRYYQANLSHYKLNQAMIPMHQEIRRSYLQTPQSWQAALTSTGYLYEFTETKTPYSDELTIAYRYQLLGGTFEAKWVNRANQRVINRQKTYNEHRQPVLSAVNNGSSHYQRYSLSWMANYEQQHIGVNISTDSNKVDKASFDNLIEYDRVNKAYAGTKHMDDSAIVFLQYDEVYYDDHTKRLKNRIKNKLISRHDLSLENQDYNRPFIANINWGMTISQWQLTLHARYVAKQLAIYPTDLMQAAQLATSVCDNCNISQKYYPVYATHKRPSYSQLNGSIKYHWQLSTHERLTLSIDGENLLNQRSYQIGPLGNGSELGRQLWLSIGFEH